MVCKENGRHLEANQALLQRSVELAKADLMSEMVYEFTELQGIMGYYYAKELGEEPEVALAIKEQYLPEGEDSPLPTTRMSAIVAMANKLDTLLGLFSINKIPTGSRDPFGLRRAVNGLIRISLEYGFEFDISSIFKKLAKGYGDIDHEKLENFFLERVNQFYDVNPSIVKSVLSSGERDLLEIDAKINAVNTIVQSESFPTLFSTFKRVANITRDVYIEDELHIRKELFESSHESALFDAYQSVNNRQYDSYVEKLDAFFSLKPQLDDFFDNVMVNADDEMLKINRKSLVASVYKSILSIADIKEISI
jgi:glycyl-tRNA synthetase beta chain